MNILEALSLAKITFENYARIHRQKNTLEGANKAKENERLSEIMAQAEISAEEDQKETKGINEILELLCSRITKTGSPNFPCIWYQSNPHPSGHQWRLQLSHKESVGMGSGPTPRWTCESRKALQEFNEKRN